MAADEFYTFHFNRATAHGRMCDSQVKSSYPQSPDQPNAPQPAELRQQKRQNLGSEKASRHGRQVSGKLHRGGGSRKNQEVQEKDQMVREPEQDLHHSPLDRVCRLTHEPPV